MNPLLEQTVVDGVLHLLAGNGPVNALSRPMRQALLDAARRSQADRSIAAVVLACAGRTFFAGADLAELEAGLQLPGLLELVDLCDRAPQPWVAALHGTVFGGGIVVAYACDWRVAASDARFALPEVGLGLLPTFGGTQLLPRLLGVEAALELAVDGRPWSAAEALAHGLVDEVVAPGELATAADALARRGLGKRRVRELRRHLEDGSAAARAFEQRRDAMPLRWRGAEAPGRCLDVMQRGLALPLPQGLALEHEAFLELLASAQSRRLRRLFFAERAARRGIADRAALLHRLRSAGSGRAPLRQTALELMRETGLSAAVIDALIVEALDLPRHEASLIDDLLQETA